MSQAEPAAHREGAVSPAPDRAEPPRVSSPPDQHHRLALRRLLVVLIDIAANPLGTPSDPVATSRRRRRLPKKMSAGMAAPTDAGAELMHTSLLHADSSTLRVPARHWQPARRAGELGRRTSHTGQALIIWRPGGAVLQERAAARAHGRTPLRPGGHR